MRRVADYPLWLGHLGAAQDVTALLDQGIEAVVDLAGNEPPIRFPRGLIACRFPLTDGGGNSARLLRVAVETVTNLIREQTPTLVYCGAGMSRTPAVVGLALARVRGCSPAAGLVLVTRSGPVDISPTLWSELTAATGVGKSQDDAGRPDLLGAGDR